MSQQGSNEMSEGFRVAHQVAWADLDANGHMANRAFLDYATQTRFVLIASLGFTPGDFKKHGVGPVILEDRIRYYKELMFLDRFHVDFTVSEQSEDGSRFTIGNRFYRGDTLCAEIQTRGAWFSLRERKILAPPQELRVAMDAMPPLEGA